MSIIQLTDMMTEITLVCFIPEKEFFISPIMPIYGLILWFS